MKNRLLVAGAAALLGLVLMGGAIAPAAAAMVPHLDWGSLLLSIGPATGQDQPKPVITREA